MGESYAKEAILKLPFHWVFLMRANLNVGKGARGMPPTHLTGGDDGPVRLINDTLTFPQARLGHPGRPERDDNNPIIIRVPPGPV